MKQPNRNGIDRNEATKSIAGMEKYGFKGTDVSLEISLFEYDMVWTEGEEKGEWFFVHRHPNVAGRFDWSCINESETWNWANMDEIYAAHDVTKEEWDQILFPLRVFYMANYHGIENIFGSSHWEGWEITE